MALPELDTADISWIAYWNFLDHGGTSIDPMEAAGSMDSFQEYTNGVQGIYSWNFSRSAPRDFGVRVKDDGWIVAWMDRQYDEGVNVNWGHSMHNPMDLIHDWTDKGGPDSLPGTTLGRTINNLKGALSNGAEATLNWADVGLYNYETPNASTITLFSQIKRDDPDIVATLTPSAGTTLHMGWLGSSNSDDYDYAGGTWANSQESVSLGNRGQNTTRDVVGRGEITPGETVDVEMHSYGIDEIVCDVLFTWS